MSLPTYYLAASSKEGVNKIYFIRLRIRARINSITCTIWDTGFNAIDEKHNNQIIMCFSINKIEQLSNVDLSLGNHKHHLH